MNSNHSECAFQDNEQQCHNKKKKRAKRNERDRGRERERDTRHSLLGFVQNCERRTYEERLRLRAPLKIGATTFTMCVLNLRNYSIRFFLSSYLFFSTLRDRCMACVQSSVHILRYSQFAFALISHTVCASTKCRAPKTEKHAACCILSKIKYQKN